jgi:UDP-N-acetylmuramyl pentapeptide phosphotransferase/UDP-N-acetylglucosamine-1-phosphate transferase
MTTVSERLAWRLIAILVGSFGVCALVIMTQRWHGRLSLDHDLQAIQKLHKDPVPRIGGLGLLVGLLIAVLGAYLVKGQSFPTTLILLICAVPVFLAGLVEDLTKRVSVKVRLYASFVSAALAVWLLNARLINVDTPVLDSLLALPAVSVAFTVFAVAGVTHSVNIIDGLNGLAAGAVSIMLAGLAGLAWMHGDTLVTRLCLWGIAAMVGFMLLNYPFGRIFLGDGGAYLVGFWVAECAVLLLARNPQVSTWTVLLACAYPVWETVFSIYRRHMIHHVSSGLADSGHLHHQIFRRMASTALLSDMPTWMHHGFATASIWAMVAACQGYAIYFHSSSSAAAFGLLLFVMTYTHIYRATPLMTTDIEPPAGGTFNKSARI